MSDLNKKPRRRRADSVEAAVADMLAAERAIAPPADMALTKAELTTFDEIISELPKGEWSDHTIRMAADLARTMADARAEQDALRREGSVVQGAAGGPIRNPRCTQLAALRATILATRRNLSLHARAKSGMDNRVLARRREIQAGNERIPFNDDDDLISRPPLN